jgi:hypothetical protein
MAILAGWVLVVGVALSAGRAGAQLTSPEFFCQYKSGRSAWKLMYAEARCVLVCQKQVLVGSAPASDCVPPYAGDTLACVQARAQNTAGQICELCAVDLPECYAASCTQHADDRVAAIGAAVDGLAPLIFCDDSASDDGLTGGEFRCAHTALRYAAKAAADRATCLAKCRSAEHALRIPAGSCDAGGVTDPTGRTQLCLDKAEARAVKLIDRFCNPAVEPGADPLECHNGTTGDGWLAQVHAAVQAEDSSYFCAEP